MNFLRKMKIGFGVSSLFFGALVMSAFPLLAAQQWAWHGAEFNTYAQGEALNAEKGAVGGVWAPEQEDAKALGGNIVRRDGLQCAAVSTALDAGVYFVADRDSSAAKESWGLAHVSFPTILDASWTPPALTAEDRAAFLVGLSSGNGKPAFFGWTASGWKELVSSDVEALFDCWYDVCTRFVVEGDALKVEYRVEKDGRYVTLTEKGTGASLFPCAGTGTAWHRVLLRGDGYVGALGSHLKDGRIDVRVRPHN